MRLYTHTHTSSFIGKQNNQKGWNINQSYCPFASKNSKANGITLVALVVTIVVLLILAGITITYVLGDNSVFKQAQNAKVQTELGKIEEQAGVIYSDLLAKKHTGQIDEIRNIDIANELISKGNSIEIRTEAAADRTDVKLEPSEVSLDKNQTATVKLVINGSEDGNLYYAVVDGKYYEMKFEKGYLTIGRKEVTPTGTEVTMPKLEIVDDYEKTIVTSAVVNEINNTISITSGETYGNTTVHVNYGGKALECPVTVEVQESDWAKIAEVAKLVAADSTITNETKEINKGGMKITVGDSFYVKYNKELKEVRVLGFNHDELTSPTSGYGNGATTAGISFEFIDCIGKHNMNGKDLSSSTNENGWTTTEMKAYLDTEINSNKFSKALKNNVKEVKKQYIKKYNDDTSNNNYSNDKLWLLACSEIFAQNEGGTRYGLAITTEGDQYKFYKDLKPTYNSSNPELVKKLDGSSSDWLLRSPAYNSNTGFGYINDSGNGETAYNSFYASGVAPGFCI